MGTYDLLMDDSGNKEILEQTVMKSSVLMEYLHDDVRETNLKVNGFLRN